jgi:uncharacterized protein involved in exopolysaccharide biosynthesis
MNSTELKSKAYDTLAQIEYLQKQLQELNQQIAKALQDEQVNSDSDNN